jgi:predicted O-linked N-acetylglucosamine transferase (SPINDLY family)
MGILVVTLAGDRHAGRICATVLTAVGLPDLIARAPDEYV